MKRKRAAILFRAHRHYRSELFEAGLQRLGFSVSKQAAARPEPGDVLILWNRLRQHESIARNYERRDAAVICVENAYIGNEFFAMARSYHNGAGVWRVGGPDRWRGFGIELKPWREDGRFVVALPQRGIGPQGIAMPAHWKKRIVPTLQRLTHREVRFRPHPGNHRIEPYNDLRGAWAAVTWGSGAGIKAIAAGIPVFHEFPKWIGAPAARLLPKSGNLEEPFLGDRLPMFERLAWAQWRPPEVQSGEAFEWLL